MVLPRPLPCVHLGGRDRLAWGIQTASCGLPAVFECPKHGKCCPEGTLPEGYPVRSCARCRDYLARDPVGPSAETMAARALDYLRALPGYPRDKYHGQGCVIAGGGERYLPGVYVTVRLLRALGWALPIQLWYLGSRDELPERWRYVLAPYGVEHIDADALANRQGVKKLAGWPLKVYATLHSRFQEVMFLDADCYPVLPPAHLFDDDGYRGCGSLFWPDSSGPDSRLKWPAFGVADPHFASSIESGVYVLDKRICWRPLNLAWFYNDHSDFYYHYCYGDKHTFEVAWPACGARYSMFASRGVYNDSGYLHPGPDGRIMFVHRCSDKFRLSPAEYVTRQMSAMSGYRAGMPLEEKCWAFMGELRSALSRSSNP